MADRVEIYKNTNVTGMNRQSATWHCHGGFQGAATAIACTKDTWAWVTNGTNNLWAMPQLDGFSITGDILTVTNTGDYTGHLSMAISGGTANDFFIRAFNITQDVQMGYIIGVSTTGANNYQTLSLPLYLELTAGDTFRFEIENTTDDDDPTVRSAIVWLGYLHD